MNKSIAVFWFRRDLRLQDNVGLLHALNSDHPVLPIFIFDTDILDTLPKDDARVTFIHEQLQQINHQLNDHGSSLSIFHGKPIHIFKQLLEKYTVNAVYTNHDY
ncbi:MAG: deoxyribodipyrimidine photo-lyase, partial [Bacteroidia bacterium]|nr:deoxyribodipyrimidine photo-lyase [Bacteroidia bacterium]